jgi:hypothetical protein
MDMKFHAECLGAIASSKTTLFVEVAPNRSERIERHIYYLVRHYR